MQISAKFQTVCPACRRRIAVGERIEWERGKPAVHVACPSAQQDLPETTRRPKARKASAPHPADDCDIRDSAGFYDFDSPDSYSP